MIAKDHSDATEDPWCGPTTATDPERGAPLRHSLRSPMWARDASQYGGLYGPGAARTHVRATTEALKYGVYAGRRRLRHVTRSERGSHKSLRSIRGGAKVIKTLIRRIAVIAVIAVSVCAPHPRSHPRQPPHANGRKFLLTFLNFF